MSETPLTNLRKADFWTSLVLMAIAAGMLLNTFSMPLEGTYAGVRNAWYVSPALFPLIVAVALLVLSAILFANAIRTGGAQAALQALRDPQLDRFWTSTEDFWIVGGVLTIYIYILISRTDFIAATSLLLFTLVAAYDLDSTHAARRTLALFTATAAVVMLAELLGFEPAPRSSEAYARDAFVWVALTLSVGVAAHAVRAESAGRQRLGRCIWISLLTPIVLGTIFKFGLLVPLPNEGITVEILDWIRYGLQGLLAS